MSEVLTATQRGLAEPHVAFSEQLLVFHFKVLQNSPIQNRKIKIHLKGANLFSLIVIFKAPKVVIYTNSIIQLKTVIEGLLQASFLKGTS